MKIQGSLGSGHPKDGEKNSSRNGDDDGWLYLTDGRVIPKDRSGFRSRNGVPAQHFAKPTSLNGIVLYLEDSERGRTTDHKPIGAFRHADVRSIMVDDSTWVELKVHLDPLLERAGIDKWDKIVLKDNTGNGFHIRIDQVHLTSKESEGESDNGDDDSEIEAEVFANEVRSKEPRKVVRRVWLKDAPENRPASPTRNRTGANFQTCSSYGSPIEVAHLSDDELKEPSGFTSSRVHDGIIWTHQDRDTTPYLFGLVASTGEVVSKHYFDVIKYHETDWEDIASALCPDQSGDTCLWIADSGNVKRDREEFFVHVFREPDLLERDGHISSDDIWTFTYRFPKDGNKDRPWVDIESLVVLPDGSKFWLIEKTVNGHGNGPATIWEVPSGYGPIDLVTKNDGDSVLKEFTRRGRDAIWDHEDLVMELKLAKKIVNPDVSNVVHSFLDPGRFDPPLEEWVREKMERGDQDWNKLRAITGADIHPSGKSLVACTYSGIWEYPLEKAFDLGSLGEPKLLSLTNRYDDPFWQTESVAYDSAGDGIWVASEYYKGHQPIRYFGCA